MPANVDCPLCGMAIVASRPSVGAVITCPHCSERFQVDSEGVPVPLTRRLAAGRPAAARDLRFTFTCLRCDSILEARGGMCGERGRCPTCGGVFTIPGVDPRTGLAMGPARPAEDGQLPTPMHAYATAGGKAPRIRRLEDGRQVIICPRCGREMSIEANRCSACGLPFTMEGAAQVGHAGYAGNRPATAALVAGVFAVPTFCFPLIAVAAICLGLAGLRRAASLGPQRPGRGPALAGMLLGLLSCAVWVVWMVL